ncbi:MAG: hypothetical protein R2751_13555 [Bacteroidales bacterium]
MKKSIFLFALLLSVGLNAAAQDKFMQKMGETLGKWAQAQSVSDLQVLANDFHTIAQAESGHWLPVYYEANCYITMAFLNGMPAAEKDEVLDRAEELIGTLKELAPEESEVYALESFCHTGRMVIDPASRAMSYAPLISVAIGKSLALDPNNPRAKFMRLSNDIGTARFFGQDVSRFCEQARDILENWDAYELRSPIHPNWGKEQVEEILNDC